MHISIVKLEMYYIRNQKALALFKLLLTNVDMPLVIYSFERSILLAFKSVCLSHEGAVAQCQSANVGP